MKLKNLIYLCMVLLVVLSSCSEDDPKPSKISNVVYITESITEPTIWYSDSLYVVVNSINIDAQLTIRAGTIVKFNENTNIELFENGSILAIGTEDLPILFTSIKDDTGGDTNEDLIATTPHAGDWDVIDLGNQDGSQFVYCIFTYGGDDNYSGVLELGENSSKVDHCIFANNTSYVLDDVYFGALAAQDAAQSTIITYNSFYNNKVPLSINGHLSINNSNNFADPNDLLLGNTYNGIFVHGQDIKDYDVSWLEDEVAYVIQYDGFEIWDGYSLTLGDEVVLKFYEESMLDVQLNAELINYNGKGVYFTSYKDDDHKGDTNGDGLATTPTATEWMGVYNNQESNYFYTWSNILYSKNDF